MGRSGYVALLVVCLGWFAYQSLRVAPQDDPATVVIWSGWGEQSPAFELYHQWWDALEREQGIKVTHVSLKNEVMIQQANRSFAAVRYGTAPTDVDTDAVRGEFYCDNIAQFGDVLPDKFSPPRWT